MDEQIITTKNSDGSVSLSRLTFVRQLLPELGLASVIINVLSLAVPLMLLQIYDRILPHNSVSTFGILLGGVLVALAIESLVRMGRSYITGWIGASFEHRLSCAVFDRLLQAPLPEFERDGASVHLERLRATAQAREFYSGQALLSLFDLPFAVVYIVVIALLGGWLAVVPMTLLAVFTGVAIWNGRQVRADIRRRSEFDERRFSFLSETLGGIHTVKTMAMEAIMQRRYEMLQDTSVDRSYDASKNSIFALNLAALFSQLSTVAVVAAGAAFVVEGAMTQGALAACIMLAGRSLQPLQAVLGTWVRFQTFLVARQQIDKLLALPRQANAGQPPLPPVQGGIELDNITLSYRSTATPLFKELSASIRPGECVAIQGDNGSGKSTLLGLIAGFLQPSEGRVSIDGFALDDHSPSSLAQQIAYLPQQGVLVEGTIIENITMFDASLEVAALDVARQLGLDRVVAGMRFGYDTPVGNSASEAMPAGVKQRIAIARALVHDPAVVLFDEANIAIDSAGDEMLRVYLEAIKGKKTMVLVTHRPSLVKLADRTLTIHDGRLVEGKVGGVGLPAMPGGGTALQVVERPKADERIASNIVARFPKHSDIGMCLPALLTAHQWRGNPRQLAEAMPHVADSLDISGLRRVMANLNFTGHTFRTRLKNLDPRILPCLFLPDDGDARVIFRHEPDKGFVAFNGGLLKSEHLDPDGTMGEAHVFRPSEAANSNEPGSWTGRVFARFRPLMWLTLLLTIGINVMVLATPLFVMVVYNHVLPSGALALIPYLTAGLAVALGIDWVLRRLRSQILAYIGGRGEFILGGAVFERIMALPAWATEQVTVGSQIARIKDLESLRDAFIGPVALLFYELPATIVFVIVLGVINPWMLAVIMGSLVCYAVLGLATQPGMAARSAASGRAASQRQEFLSDALVKMRAVKQAGAEGRWYDRFRLLSGKAVAAEFASQQFGAVVAALAQSLGVLTGLLALSACVIGAFTGTTSMGAVVASMIISWRLVSPIQNGFLSLATLYRSVGSIKQIDNLMKLKVEREAAAPRQPTPSYRGELSFNRVSFRYSNEADPVLLGVTLKIDPRRVVAVAGPNGAGKSTLLKMITGVYLPQAGSVRLDNVDIRQLDPTDLRGLVSYVPQRCDVFYGTISQNLRLCHPTANDDELHWATDLAGLHDEIMAMPRGYETRIQDGQGEQLPNGFKQRLALARAYLKPAPLMLFDEPGNGLDMEGDKAFLAAVQHLRQQATIIIVSHRPSHLRVADAVVYMEDGYIREVGTFDKLSNLIMGQNR
jgi:ATP-binding cassette subfamily B protein